MLDFKKIVIWLISACFYLLWLDKMDIYKGFVLSASGGCIRFPGLKKNDIVLSIFGWPS